MPRIAVLFELSHADTTPGDMVHIVGARSELGCWQPGLLVPALQMRTSALEYPRWAMAEPVWIEHKNEPGGVSLEYKYVIIGGRSCRWEAGCNRSITLPCHQQRDCMYIVTDRKWSLTGVGALVSSSPLGRTTLQGRRCSLISKKPKARRAVEDAASQSQTCSSDSCSESEWECCYGEGEESVEPGHRSAPRRCASLGPTVRRKMIGGAKERCASNLGADPEVMAIIKAKRKDKYDDQALRHENKVLKLALRALAAADQAAWKPREERSARPSASPLMSPNMSPTMTPNRSPRMSLCDQAAGEPRPAESKRRSSTVAADALNGSAQNSSLSVSFLQSSSWDWPLSRCERKLRLQIMDSHLLNLEVSEMTEKIAAEMTEKIAEIRRTSSSSC
eukprot:TRINITY_DN35777_c0_g1_i1.p1 TRINITY_DN35777_c0_g1~~TRINITY_DN35777_c0_g1_i1.p1  ORF type:complete len:391 (-),score=67.76 TRINITY_DN35777_c0_g1_i1:27-1199(-)